VYQYDNHHPPTFEYVSYDWFSRTVLLFLWQINDDDDELDNLPFEIITQRNFTEDFLLDNSSFILKWCS